MDPDVEVVFDLPVGADGPRYPASEQLDVEVQRMRCEVVFTSHDGPRPGGSAVEALELLEVHSTAREGVVVSALLLCTHRRFERCSRTLMRRIDESDLLADDQLDVLAIVLLAEDRVPFAIPATWWGGEVEVPPGRQIRSSGYELVPVGDDDPTWPYLQNVPAAARRWAVRRLLGRRLATVEAALKRIEGLDEPGAGGAVLSGVLDAWASCRPENVQPAVDAALASNLASVRRRALDVLELDDRLDETRALARDDGAPNAAIGRSRRLHVGTAPAAGISQLSETREAIAQRPRHPRTSRRPSRPTAAAATTDPYQAPVCRRARSAALR